MRLIDLSHALDNDRSWAPWWARNKVVRQSHRFGAWVIWWLFGLRAKHLQTGVGWANDALQLSTHGTTHVDAPWHYGPMCAGRPARTIDQMPLEWFFRPGVVLDLRHKADGEAISVNDVQAALAKISHTLQPNEIVLIQTGNDARWGTPDYFTHGSGMSAAATRWLLEQGVRVTGIDSWGWDVPLNVQASEVRKSGQTGHFWEAHYVGTELEYCHMERLTNLAALPATGFWVCAFPLKVAGGSAGPARVVAVVPEGPEVGQILR